MVNTPIALEQGDSRQLRLTREPCQGLAFSIIVWSHRTILLRNHKRPMPSIVSVAGSGTGTISGGGSADGVIEGGVENTVGVSV